MVAFEFGAHKIVPRFKPFFFGGELLPAVINAGNGYGQNAVNLFGRVFGAVYINNHIFRITYRPFGGDRKGDYRLVADRNGVDGVYCDFCFNGKNCERGGNYDNTCSLLTVADCRRNRVIARVKAAYLPRLRAGQTGVSVETAQAFGSRHDNSFAVTDGEIKYPVFVCAVAGNINSYCLIFICVGAAFRDYIAVMAVGHRTQHGVNILLRKPDFIREAGKVCKGIRARHFSCCETFDAVCGVIRAVNRAEGAFSAVVITVCDIAVAFNDADNTARVSGVFAREGDAARAVAVCC